MKLYFCIYVNEFAHFDVDTPSFYLYIIFHIFSDTKYTKN